MEIDGALIQPLRDRFPSVELIHADVLGIDFSQWPEAVIAGNLPYYIASPILDKVLSAPVKRAVFLVQREVAERIAAQPGSRDFGYLSAATQCRATAEVLFRVPPSAFKPPPKVDSAVVALTPHATRPPAGFLGFLSACFRHKRKTLRNNLAGSYPAIAGSPEAALRAEQLGAGQLLDLFHRLRETG